MKILVLYGPNMNLLGLRSSKNGKQLTLDKVNRALRKEIRNSDSELKILQTHSETKAVTFLQRERNSTDGIVFIPEVWHKCGAIIKDTLELIDIPVVIVSLSERDDSIFNDYPLVVSGNSVEACVLGLKKMLQILSKD